MKPIRLLTHFIPAFVLLLAAAVGRAQETIVNGKPLGALVDGRIDAPPTVWTGEVFTLRKTISVASGAFGSVSPDFSWTPPGAILEDWTGPVRSSTDTRELITATTRGYLRTPGAVALPESTQAVSLITSRAGDGSAITDSYTIPVTPPRLTVRALPAPEPAEFTGAVGEFTMKSTVSTLTPRPGEALTWTLELSGTGNWPEISRLPPRVVSKDFTAIAPVLKRDLKPGTLFEGTLTEDVLLVPTKTGEYQLGPVRFVFFDPRRGKYQMLTTETFVVSVGQAPARATSTELPDRTGGPRRLVTNAPPSLPRDPLPPGGSALRPISPGAQRVAGIGIGLALAAYWLSLATKRSRLTDPLHSRREAGRRLEHTLAQLDRNTLGAADRRRLLSAWQEATIAFAGLRLATPTAVEIARAVEKLPGTVGSSWAPLWREANAALYGNATSLPADWVMRARAALSEQEVAPVPFQARFFRRNLLPFAAVVVLATVTAPRAHADGLESYRQGDFAAAEKAWRRVVAVHPLDPRAHYDLALAAAQQNRWTESLAQSLAAFCLAPRDEAIRWQLALSVDRTGIDNPAFSGFVAPSGRFRIARLLSAGEWTLVRVLAFALGGLGVATLLGCAYGARSRRRAWLGAATAAVALAAIVAATVSIGCYGPLADENTAIVARSVLLCSVPTEIDTAQKTAPLPAGTLATVDTTFLGWTRLVFPNHQTGWARTDALVTLYR